MLIQERLTYLLRQALNHSATDAELQELSDLVGDDLTGDVAQQLEMLLQADLPDASYDVVYWDQIASKILAADQLTTHTPVIPLPARRPLRWIPAAAAVLLLLSAGWYAWQHKSRQAPAVATATPVLKNDIAPGGNKAMLTLADGTQVPLDSTGNEPLAQQGNTRISRPSGGQLMYTAMADNTNASGALSYNTLSTPRGGQFQVTLPDGTKVWLNAASSLKYPVAFSGRNRQVELTGEAYFDVAPNAAMPFRVTTRTGGDSLEVTVLGTQFNIMAYEDEGLMKTTLLEGAVKVSNHHSSQQLAPGQGAQLDKQNHQLAIVPHVNTEEAIAWKNGFIQLEGNDIASAMRLIARWYNMEVVYKAPVTAHFRGIIPRNVPVSQVLKMMEMTGEAHFEIRGRQIIVSP